MSSQPDLPASVHVREVGPRDGFQNEPERIPTADKLALIGLLVDAGCERIEVASFVRADVIPQLDDAAAVLAGLEVPEGVERTVLVPNPRGLEAALALRDRFEAISFFLSASETHNRANVNRGVEESLRAIEAMLGETRAAGLAAHAVIATSFGCPYEGHVDPARVRAIAGRLAAAGATEVGFGDTTGMANPRQVRAFFADAFADPALRGVELTAHFHNTRGQGLANVLAALEAGVTSFESSFGELGGCPVPPGSTGNVASEDVISMLHEMGIATGVALDALVAASRAAQELLGRPLGAHVLRAGPVDWHETRPTM